MYGCRRAELLGHIALGRFQARLPPTPVDSPYFRNPDPYIRNRNPYIRNQIPYIRNRTNQQDVEFKGKKCVFLS